MKQIPMVDLKGQYTKIKDQVDSAIIEVIENTAFINGPQVKSFQKNHERYVKRVSPPFPKQGGSPLGDRRPLGKVIILNENFTNLKITSGILH